MSRRSIVIASALLAVSGLAIAPPPTWASGSPPSPAPKTVGQATTESVTLITGDQVTLSGVGGQKVVQVTDPQGGAPGFRTHQLGDDLYVVPDTAAPLIAEDRVDEQLFNVTKLIADRYDDAHSSSIPLIVSYPDSAAAASAPAPLGARVSDRLPRLRMTAMRATKSAAPAFWEDVQRRQRSRSAAPAKIWLDAKVSSTDTAALQQVRAAEAWAAGYTGKGVKVAVLDTGIDAGHPDVAASIVASKDFTGNGSTADGHGHGTHAASSVIGNGSASQGKYREGVAPDASLYVGKVLTDSGSGPTSVVLAGMQWAVENGVEVVSMSLGAPVKLCNDPMAAAVDQLSASSDTLFVIAAGNTGPGPGTVSSPGCAVSALTVAADDSNLKTASFSARGPVDDGAGHHYLKPDMAAPGVGVIGARAAGTSLGAPVDENYTTLSGTSMATPHVAGAAAVLAQRHPDWTSTQLKQGLMSSVRPDALNPPLAEGTGFLDVARAVSATVTGPGYVDGDNLPWPHGPDQISEREVTWKNTGDSAITLNLETTAFDGNGRPAPEGVASLSTGSVTVPAGGSASATLRMSVPGALPDGGYGQFTGRITASATDGGQYAVTSFGFYAEPNTVTVTFEGITRGDGKAGTLSYANLISRDTRTATRVYFRNGAATATIPAGTYDLDAGIYGYDPGIDEQDLYHTVKSIGFLFRPGLQFTEDTTEILDARTAHRVKLSASRPLESHTTSVRYQRNVGGVVFAASVIYGANVTDVAVTDVPAGQWPDARVDFVTRAYAPLLKIATTRGHTLEAMYAKYSPVTTDGIAYLPQGGSARVVDVGAGTAAELAAADVADRFVLVDLGSKDSESTIRLEQVTKDAVERGARGVVVAHGFAGRWSPFAKDDIPVIAVTTDDYAALKQELADGTTRLKWSGTPNSPYVYNVHIPWTDGIPADQTHALDEAGLAQVEETWSSQARRQQYGDGLAVAYTPGAQPVTVSIVQPVLAPTKRTAYYTTGEDSWVHWGTSNTAAGADQMAGRPTRYEKPVRHTEHWYGGPLHPQPVTNIVNGETTPLASRNGDAISTVVPSTGDSDGHVSFQAMTDQFALKLTRDGEAVGPTASGGIASWPVPSGSGRYELSLDQKRRTDLPIFRTWALSTSISTRWSFDSGSVDKETSLPLLVPAYGMALNPYNQAPASRSYRVELDAPGQPGYEGRADTLTAQVSYDGGASWRDVRTVRRGGSWVALVDNRPASGGFVSLRVKAANSDGADVEQTLISAYAVR
ncbi:S8 family serine peptidase [Streptomyces sp. NBC_00385]|uniref:S8 family serine peptidase n=1 Tax=Streptomyces sp. NBC_00385 TaxID=2975733 RepID=UPI002DDA6A52|nr:S8 family serine peptidase [Streptomyces sp. NBC_00385]WRZ03676.1 S8 family serine peptidase [Streptomyces sp. NBC_00385]